MRPSMSARSILRTPIQRHAARLLAAGVILTALAGMPARADDNPLGAELQQELAGTEPLEIGGVSLDRARLAIAYDRRSFAPVWDARPQMAAALFAAIGDAGREGLDPEDFGLSALQAALGGGGMTPADRDLLLSDRFLAYAQALGQGRVAPAAVDEDWLLARPAFDPATVLRRLADSGDVAAVLQSLLPVAPDYDRLRQALQKYQALVAAGGWPAVVSDRKIEPGQKGAVVKALRARLVVEGDLAAEVREGDGFDAALAAAVRHFQTRHGIAVDGRVGEATLAALNVTAAQRVAQIKLTLERWRSMPRSFPATRLVVNIPAETLALYRADALELTSRVIVGALDHPTPVLAARISATLFNPPWNVPASITRKEIQPKLERDPGYLARNHYVIIGRGGGDPHGKDINWKRTDVLKRGWRLQQEPGPWNSLGGVKFELPNALDVYLHDTPTRPLFGRALRAASHGCVRVEEARPLASTLLGADWPASAIDQAIEAGETKRVFLKVVVPVYLLYLTSVADEDGTIAFYDDVYGRDQRLQAALEARRRLASDS
jgi:L,D-transpeptidase YcbB